MNLVIDKRNEKYVFYKLKSENVIFTNTVTNIINNLDDYPQLIIDRNKLSDKDQYLKQCNINSNINIY